jgi:cell division protein FtsW (lipid II flippase)
MDTRKDEKKLLRYTYLLCIVCFLNLALIRTPFDKKAIIIALIICFLIGCSYFIIRKFFSDGDKYIFIFSSILSVIGLVMLYRLDTAEAIKQVMWFAIAITAYILIVVLLPDVKSFSRYRYIYMIMALIFMGMAILFGTEINGARNWIVIGAYSFQPSEFGKLFFVAYLAIALKDYKNFNDLKEPAVFVMICIVFMVVEKALGAALIFFGIAIIMLYIATSKLKYISACLVFLMGGSAISYKLFAYFRTRILIWKNPWPYANNQSYQIVQSLISIASGGLIGTGLGLGHPEYVPVNTTDFIFSAICEELGIIIGFGLLIIYFLLAYRCMRAALYVENKFSKLLTVGYSSMIVLQVIVIVGGVTNMIPLTGIMLPLISYGGSSMIITFISLGIIQKISEESSYKNN